MMPNLPNMDWITPLGLPTIFATYDEKLPKLDLYESGSRVYLKVHNPCYAAYHPDVRCFDEVTYSPLQLPDKIKTFIKMKWLPMRRRSFWAAAAVGTGPPFVGAIQTCGRREDPTGGCRGSRGPIFD